MNHIQFIEHNIKQELLAAGYSLPIAQGGQILELTTIGAAHRQAQREKCLMTAYGWLKRGQLRTQRRLIKPKQRKPSLGSQSTGRLLCSKENAPTASTVRASVIRYASQLQR